MEYLNLPIDFSELVQGRKAKRCITTKSIEQNIHMMLTSYIGELKHDHRFGNLLWEDEFVNIKKKSALVDEIKFSIHENIQLFENRLRVSMNDIIVSHRYEEYEMENRLKRKVDILIRGLNLVENKPFEFHEFFFIAPLSY